MKSNELKAFLKRELEEGTYFLHPDKIFPRLGEMLRPREGKRELDSEGADLSCQIAAGLAIYHPSAYGDFFRALISDRQFPTGSKLRALELVRNHCLDPDRASAGFSLYASCVRAEDAALKDFSSRSFLQLLTEMRVGGQLEPILAREGNRGEICRLLKDLSSEGWLEADELLDLLELAS